MAEMRVIVEGGYNATTGAVINPLPVTPTNTAATAEFVKITDGTSTATIVSNAYIGNAIAVESGFILGAITINGASGNINGAAVDAGAAKSNWAAYAVGTGTLTGTLTMQLSYDGGNWFDASTTASLTAAGSVPLYSTGRVARYARVNLTAAAGVGTVTVNMMGAS